ncbi:hypothetical protein HanRHA438_Chr09g0402771 [Helianthus annuus]|nr:hypothetical protein HanIR_Chr09g0421891 [Helianthus annuus]KAJ0888510.1 hypothetical protein HanRHA438_Chr09g0402771 [Helianthus annuus]
MFAFEVIETIFELFEENYAEKGLVPDESSVVRADRGISWLDAKTGPLVYWIEGLSSAIYSKLTLPLFCFVNILSVGGGGHDVPFIKTKTPKNRQFGCLDLENWMLVWMFGFRKFNFSYLMF